MVITLTRKCYTQSNLSSESFRCTNGFKILDTESLEPPSRGRVKLRSRLIQLFYIPCQREEYGRTILRVSRQLYEEASMILFEQNVFRYRYQHSCIWPLHGASKRPIPGALNQSLNRIKHLELEMNDTFLPPSLSRESQAFIDTLLYFSRRGCALKSLRLVFWNP